MAQATTAVRRAVTVAIGILNAAASRLESVEQKRARGQARTDVDTDTARLFRFFFRHDPDRPLSSTDSTTSGSNVAHRLRQAAEAIVKRGIHFRCACPGGSATLRGRAAHGAIHIRLCNAFWNLDPRVRADAETFRAGILLHETLHIIYDHMVDGGAHRANAHCYEAFALRASGHAADPSDVRRCRPDRIRRP